MRLPFLADTAASSLRWFARLGLLGAASWLAGCSTPPPRQVSAPEPAPVAVEKPAAAPEAATPLLTSSAASPRDYRRYGAGHIYAQNPSRIYKGQMPPLLYAVGVLNVDIDAMGHVERIDWMRAPRHAPEVMAEIERTVRAAAPFPAPTRMGRVTWTDTWLWDRSGRFQLDTLTEGQLGRAVIPPRPRK